MGAAIRATCGRGAAGGVAATVLGAPGGDTRPVDGPVDEESEMVASWFA